MDDREEGPFARSQAYRSLRSFTKFYTGKEKNRDVPSAVEISTGSGHGYLWRLSSRRMVYTQDWKRKYFVLAGERLYYYESENSQGGERGSGVIDLRCFQDCVEAPLTDHKKATNVFILIAKERGIFEQGRYYLSAETLIDMKAWVRKIKTALQNINCEKEGSLKTEEVSVKTSPSSRNLIPEPLYASIKEESIHRSNSMSTLPSLCRGEGDMPWLNRSMDEDPNYGLGGVDHNLTYSYSSSEDSLNESFSINFSPKQSRSAETSLRRPMTVTKTKPEITLQPFSPGHLYGQVPNIYNRPTFRQSSPKKPVDSSNYLQAMYADMDRIDRQLEMVVKIECGKDKAGIAKFDEEDQEYSDNMEVDSYESNDNASQIFIDSNKKKMDEDRDGKKMQKMEDMMTDLNHQSDELQKLFRKISCEKISTRPVMSNMQRPAKPIPMTPPILDSLAKYQATMKEMETHARKMMGEIQATHHRVVQSLAESEIAKKSFLQLKDKAELILGQLQLEAKKHHLPSPHSLAADLYYSPPKQELCSPNTSPSQATIDISTQLPVYAQVRKGKHKHPPARNSVAGSDTMGGDNVGGRSQYQLRPRSLVFNKKD